MSRKFIRNKIRSIVGNRDLQDEWTRFQMDKYGYQYKPICIYTQK